jgi:ABC-type nitrate/sulfonate/bicarbonate transport system substrate-binding protein
MDRPHRYLISVIALCSTLFASVGCKSTGAGSAAKDADGLTIVRIGTEKVTSDAGIFLADKLGYFKAAGLKVRYVRLANAPAITNALATGDLEVAGASLAPGIFSSLNSRLDIKLVGDKQSIRPGVSATRLAARPEYVRESEKATLEALRGKKIAVHSNLSIQVFMLNNLLARYGMSMSDFNVTPVASPDQVSAFRGGSIDAAVMLEPYLTEGLQLGLVKQVSDLTAGTPRSGEVLTGLLYGKEFTDKPKLGEAFMVAYMRGVRAYNDAIFGGRDKDRVVQIIAQESNTPVALVAKSHPSGLDPEQRLDVPYLKRLQDFYVGRHLLPRPVDVTKLVDTSFADHARAQLGPYAAPSPSGDTR